MAKKIIAKILIYSSIFLLLSLTEKLIGMFGLCVGILFALFYCKENLFIILPTYAFSALLINFSLDYLICVSAVVLVVFLGALFHYKSGKKVLLLENSILIIVSQIPVMIFFTQTLSALALTVIGVVISVAFHYISVIVFYPVLIRGLRYRISAKEYFAAALLIIVLSIGLTSITIFNVRIYYFLATAAIIFLSNIDKKQLMPLACALGIGATIATSDQSFTAVTCILSLICLSLSSTKTYLRALGMIFIYITINYFLLESFDIISSIPALVGCLTAGLIPQKLYNRLSDIKQSYQQKFALRTVVNRDREEIGKKLNKISSAFYEMQKLLASENPVEETPETLTYAVCQGCCFTCPRYARCRDKMGDTATPVSKLVLSALDNGKATLLDAGISLGENCTKLSRLISLANDTVKQYRKMQERKSGIEQGKEMVVSQLGGVSELLNELSMSLSSTLTFDTELEKKLIEDLGYANIIATDAVIYTDNDIPKEVNLIVRESDVDKAALPKILSDVVGINMEELNRVKAVKGMVSLNYCIAPRYKILYGESIVSKEGRHCGDTRQAVKIAPSKIMFVLSDGMGTGADAHDTSSHMIMLIETFYKAGFSHKAIFSCVSRLLSLRKREDFSALDLAVVDLENGDVDFIKQGGRESYILSDKKLETIQGSALPLGIVEDAEPFIERRRLKNDDILIMLSDGITDTMSSEDFATLLCSGDFSKNPQDIAEAITADTIRLSSDHVDDMTAMVIRIVHK